MSVQERITYRIVINSEECNGCNNCTTACPVNARMNLVPGVESDDDQRVIAIKNGVAVVINPFRCDGDGICMIVCPKDAITIYFLPIEDPQKNYGDPKDITNAALTATKNE